MTNQLLTYYSQKVENLSDKLLENLTYCSEQSPFSKKTILVPNSGMQRYLELVIAKKLGICSHIKITYLSRFLWKMYKQTLSSRDNFINYEKRVLSYKILKIISNLESTSYLKATVDNCISEKHRYKLASNIAGFLIKYLNERPEIIDLWEKGQLYTSNKHEVWQKEIYLSLCLSKNSRFFLQNNFHKNLGIIDLPKTIHLFGFHHLPKSQLEDLIAISSSSKVIHYVLNPCVEYWTDIVSITQKLKMDINKPNESLLFEVGNPLLASWGSAAKYLIDTLNNYEFYNLDEDCIPKTNISLLQTVQENIKTLSEDTKFKKIVNNNSIEIHSVAGKLREVEVLKDYLLDLFESTNLVPADVVVMVPNIGDYSLYINAVFGASDTDNFIPYSIANQTILTSSTSIKLFLSILLLIENNFSVDYFFEFCNQDNICKSFNLTLTDIKTIKYWLEESRVSTGFTNEFSNSNNVLNKQHNLQKMLDELYLAYVIEDYSKESEVKFIGDSIPSNFFQIQKGETLVKLSNIFEALKTVSSFKYKSQTLDSWLLDFKKIAINFLEGTEEISNLNLLLDSWREELDIIWDNKTSYSFDFIVADIKDLMTKEELRGPFLSGGISFCSALPMRSIPSKVICMLGMDKDFPASVIKSEFDLMLEDIKVSDKNLNKESRYLFLEALLSARDILYISYSGIDNKTFKDLPPSIVVSELIDYINSISDNDKIKIKKHKLQTFNDDVKTYSNLYLINKIKSNTKNSIERNITTWSIDKIALAISNPLIFYFKYIVEVSSFKFDKKFREYEFIGGKNGLDNWLINNILLKATPEQYKKILLANNFLAPEPFFKIHMDLHKKQTCLYKEALENTLNSDYMQNIDFLEGVINYEYTNLKDTNYTIVYQLEKVGIKFQLINSFSKLKAKHIIKAWIRHVILNSLDTTIAKETKLICTDDKNNPIQIYFKKLVSSDINIYFNEIFSLIIDSTKVPLIFETSYKKEKNSIILSSNLPKVENTTISKLTSMLESDLSICNEKSNKQFAKYKSLWQQIESHIELINYI